MADFLFSGSKITADGDCSCEIRRLLLLRRKAETDLGIVLTRKDHSANKGSYSQSTVFPVVRYGCEN